MPETGYREVDGWYTDEPSLLRFFLVNSAPRSYSLAEQLKHDLQTWWSGPMWLASVASLPAALLLGKWWIAAIGVGMVAFFAPATIGLVRTHRHGRLFEPRVDRIDTGFVPPGLAACEVDLDFSEGRLKARVLVARVEAERFLSAAGALELLVVADPRAIQYAICPGLRPARQTSAADSVHSRQDDPRDPGRTRS
jgi:hypothetical protein